MTDRPQPTTYRPAQIVLHWFVVVAFITQIVIHESILRVTEAIASDTAPKTVDTILAWAHVAIGSSILLAVIMRLYLRFKFGAPGHARGTPAWQAKMAQSIHWTLYGLLLAMVVTGMLTWNGLAPLGDAHFFINVALFILVMGHAAAAVFNQFIRKDGTLRRMLPAQRKAI